MRILTVLTYYRPHTSGLTIYVERLARTLAKRGHQVTVLTSQYDKNLPRKEVIDDVRIVRAPVLLRVSKGVIMPTFGFVAWKLALQNDAIHLHLPQFDAAGVALRGRLLRKPTVITYHCDLQLPQGKFNRFVNLVVHTMNHLAGIFTHRIGAYTQDFAANSPYLTRFAKKVRVILPPVELPKTSQSEIDAFTAEHNRENHHPVIGMATRFASEKGVEVLLDALPKVLERHPKAKVLYAGQYQDVMGEEAYLRRLLPIIQRYQDMGQWKFLGNLSLDQMSAFYSNLDVLVVPSLNSTETFGLVQIEAMMNGVPCVASDLPGVRQPPRMTGMGEVVPIGDADALTEALLKIFANPEGYQGDLDEINETFNPQTNAAAYEELYQELLENLR
ncbi:MAG: glycosyltransferase family 4 protein [Anaerolineales bacterium]|nr:glycosyltransferase family 4 protein [Chloroflexota bacterium]MBL6981879.1 glycosyltransferase family 4 protein [Anaerolineales bacterium]